MKYLVIALLALFCALAEGEHTFTRKRKYQKSLRIIGGTETTIEQYPYVVPTLYNPGWFGSFDQECVGVILTSRFILSVAQCYRDNWSGEAHNPIWWRARVGSTAHNAGGVVHEILSIIIHPNFNADTFDSDISLLRTLTPITFSDTVAAGSIAGALYDLPADSVVWGVGWGWEGDSYVTNLHHVQMWSVDHETCNIRYGDILTHNMLCAGWLDVGGRDFCFGGAGSPLLQAGVIVGLSSWGHGCGVGYWPGVSTRVSMFTNWIVNTAQ